MADKSYAPLTTQKMTLPVMAKVKQLQENPELGEFRIHKVEIDKGQSWENYAETLFNINRRLADHWYHQATCWEEITDIHVDFVRKYNEQEHFAHRKRAGGRRTPQDVLGWVKGREIDPAKLDDAFTLRRVRLLDQRGYVRFQNWRIYAEAGLALRPADL